MTTVHADIDALKRLHEALVRYRYAQRGVAERAGDEIEMTRASLADKASHWAARLEQDRAELDACRAGLGDCSAYARAVEVTSERLEHIRRWQQRVDEGAGEFGVADSGFRELLDSDLPRAESQLLASIASLEAARRVQAAGPVGAAGPGGAAVPGAAASPVGAAGPGDVARCVGES